VDLLTVVNCSGTQDNMFAYLQLIVEGDPPPQMS